MANEGNKGRIKTSAIRTPREFLYSSSSVKEKYINNKLKFKKYKLYPHTICKHCSEKQGLELKTVISTFYETQCDVCSKLAPCTEVRDYGYPDIWISNRVDNIASGSANNEAINTQTNG